MQGWLRLVKVSQVMAGMARRGTVRYCAVRYVGSGLVTVRQASRGKSWSGVAGRVEFRSGRRGSVCLGSVGYVRDGSGAVRQGR